MCLGDTISRSPEIPQVVTRGPRQRMINFGKPFKGLETSGMLSHPLSAADLVCGHLAYRLRHGELKSICILFSSAVHCRNRLQSLQRLRAAASGVEPDAASESPLVSSLLDVS